MRTLTLAALLGFAATSVACASHNMSQPTAPLMGEVGTQLEADVAVGAEITGESSINVLFGWLKVGGDTQFADGVTYGQAGGTGSLIGFDPIASAKAAAAYKAVKNSGADLIVAPRYFVDIEDYVVFKTIRARVEGHKGTVRKIH